MIKFESILIKMDSLSESNNRNNRDISGKILKYIASRLFNKTLNYYYEQPWNDYFYRNTFFLIIETIIVLFLLTIMKNIHFFSNIEDKTAIYYTKLLYDIYCYITLLHTVLMLYFWSNSCNTTIKPYIANIFIATLSLSIITGFRTFIFQHSIIDIILLLGFCVIIFNKYKLFVIAYNAIYTNLTISMKKYLFFYLLMIVLNLIIYTIF